MAEAPKAPDINEVRARWGSFAWTAENGAQAKVVVGRYPPGRQHSAIIPLLDLAQRQIEQRQWSTVIQSKLQQWVNWAAEHRRPISYEPSMSAVMLSNVRSS